MNRNTAPKRRKQRRSRLKKAMVVLAIVILMLFFTACSALDSVSATEENDGIASLLGGRSQTIDILLLLTVLTLVPSILIMLTGFTRIIIVLSLARNGLGLQQMPPNQVLIGLALFLTFFVMSPVVKEIETNAYQPYIQEQIDLDEAAERAMVPIREFMLEQTYKSDLQFFINAAGEQDAVQEVRDVSNTALIPAFITSEIKRGFQIGFFIYIPFIVVDMIVSSTLMSMGMMMLPPIVISLPFKLLLFVLVDGWTLTVQTLLTSFG